MVSQQEDFDLRLREIVKNAKLILEYAEEATYHFENNDLKAVSQVLSLSHYKVSAFNRCKLSMIEELEKIGVTPGG